MAQFLTPDERVKLEYELFMRAAAADPKHPALSKRRHERAKQIVAGFSDFPDAGQSRQLTVEELGGPFVGIIAHETAQLVLPEEPKPVASFLADQL